MSEQNPPAEGPYQVGDLVRVGDDTRSVKRISAVEHGMARLDAGTDEAVYGFGLIVSLRFLRPA